MDHPFLVTSLLVAAVSLPAATTSSCSARLHCPEQGPHTSVDIPVEVSSPPPEAVHLEEVTTSADSRAVWVDGTWVWKARHWVWEDGTWQLPPMGAYYARPALVRIPVTVYEDSDGGTEQRLKGYAMRLMFIPGHWHQRTGAVVQGQIATPPPTSSGLAR